MFSLRFALVATLISILCLPAFSFDVEEIVLPAYKQTEGDALYLESSEIESELPIFGESLELPEEIQNALSFLPAVSSGHMRKFSTVMSRLHSEVEGETDLFYFVNTSIGQSYQSLAQEAFVVPSQQLVLVKRKSRSAFVFNRGFGGEIIGLNTSNVEVAFLSLGSNGQVDVKATPRFQPWSFPTRSQTPFIPVSSGIRGDGGIKTYSGLFRVNERRSNERRMNTALSAPMQYSIYINAEYDGGQESGVALHGTPPQNWHLLGKNAASHGCVRLQSDFSKWNRHILFTQNSSGGSLVPRPEIYGPVKLWNRKEHYPPSREVFAQLPSGQKLRVLFIFFEGFDGVSPAI